MITVTLQVVEILKHMTRQSTIILMNLSNIKVKSTDKNTVSLYFYKHFCVMILFDVSAHKQEQTH